MNVTEELVSKPRFTEVLETKQFLVAVTFRAASKVAKLNSVTLGGMAGVGKLILTASPVCSEAFPLHLF